MAVITPRIRYQKMFASGKIVNLGCGENPAGFGDDTVHVDLDIYNHPNFVHADLHDLPFEDDEFDTAVLGDVLEHSPDPARMLREAGRVAKKVVATVFEEWRLKDDQGKGHIRAQVDNFHEDVRKLGHTDYLAYLKTLPDHKDVIVNVTSDDEIPHHPHLQEFTEESLMQAVDDAGLEPIIKYKYIEGMASEEEFRAGVGKQRPMYNWLLVLRKK